MKYCPRCQEIKPLEEFPDNGAAGKYGYCKPCKSAYMHEYSQRNPGSNFLRNLRRTCKKVGITIDQYYETITSQDGLCAICKRQPDKFCIDHDHQTGKFRGLLCSPCNIALGGFEDKVELVESALEYLRRE